MKNTCSERESEKEVKPLPGSYRPRSSVAPTEAYSD